MTFPSFTFDAKIIVNPIVNFVKEYVVAVVLIMYSTRNYIFIMFWDII